MVECRPRCRSGGKKRCDEANVSACERVLGVFRMSILQHYNHLMGADARDTTTILGGVQTLAVRLGHPEGQPSRRLLSAGEYSTLRLP